MRTRYVRALSVCAGLIVLGLGVAAQQQQPRFLPSLDQPPVPDKLKNFVPVTDAIMRAPKPEDWLMYRGNYAGWAYSQLDQINKGNVKNLQLVWSRAMAPGAGIDGWKAFKAASASLTRPVAISRCVRSSAAI